MNETFAPKGKTKVLGNFAILAGALILSGAGAHAGPSSDGGAKSITCSYEDTTQSVLLDLYEGKEIYGDVHLNPLGSVDDYLAIAVERLNKTGYSLLVADLKDLQESLDHVISNYRLTDAQIAAVDDDFSTVEVPAGCVKSQAARFFDEDNLVIQRQVWEAMDNLNKAALFLHEAVYWMQREVTHKQDSRRARRTVSLALQESWNFTDVAEGLPESYTLCNAMPTAADGPRPLTVFAVYPSEQESFQVVQFFAIEGDYMLDWTITHIFNFPFIAEPDDTTSYSSESLGVNNEESRFTVSFRRSVRYVTEDIFYPVLRMISTRDSYPSWISKNSSLSCFPFEG